jgi:hypothetical protein
MRYALLLSSMLAVFPGALEGQMLRGTVRHEVTGVPLSGTFVVLLDADSLEVTRTITDPLGEFALAPPRSGRYRLRTERIGFRSRVSSDIVLGDGPPPTVDLEISPIVIRLAALTIRGESRECRVVGDQALGVLAVWDEARKVLEAVAWLDLQEQLIYELERFERSYTPSLALLRETRSTTPSRHVLPFRSRSPQELEERGYVIIEEDSIVYEAPDAEVFFSEPFLQHHCFALDETIQGGRRLVGLRFEPVRGRTLPDVQGVFWLDAETAALQRVAFSYVNVGVWQRERGAGGEVEFAELPDGRWIVSRWWIRMPLVVRNQTLKGPVWDLVQAVAGYEDEGGVVRRVYAGDGRTLFARDRGTVRGTVFDSTVGRGLPNAFVRLAGTDHVTITQADGSFWLPDLPEGRYTIVVDHPRAALLGVMPDAAVSLVAAGEVRVDLALPAVPTLAHRYCSDRPRAGVLGLLVGRVRDQATSTEVAGAAVQVVWLTGEGPEQRERRAEVPTDSTGSYRLCVPTGAALSVELWAGGRLLAATPAIVGVSGLLVADLTIRGPDRRPD